MVYIPNKKLFYIEIYIPSTNYKYLYNKYKNKYIRLLAQQGGMHQIHQMHSEDNGGGADAPGEVSQEILNLNSNGIQILQYCLNERDYTLEGILRISAEKANVIELFKNANESEHISQELYQNTPEDDDDDKATRAHLRMTVIKKIFKLFLDNNLILYNSGEFSKNPNPDIDISEFFDLFFVFVLKTTLHNRTSNMTSFGIANICYMWLFPQNKNQDELRIHRATNLPLIEKFINRKNYMLTSQRIISLETNKLIFPDTNEEFIRLHSDLETYKKVRNESLLLLSKIAENHPGLVKCLKLKDETKCNTNPECKWDTDKTCITNPQTWTQFFTLSNRENNIDVNVLAESKAITLILRNIDDNILIAEANLRRIIDKINEYDEYDEIEKY